MFSESGWDMRKSVSEIKETALGLAEQVMEERKEDILNVWRTIFLAEKLVCEKGLLALEEKLVYLKEMKAPYYTFFENVLVLVVDGSDSNLILEIMTNDYYVREKTPHIIYILSLYLFGIQNLLECRYYEFTFSEMLEHNLQMIPEQYKEEFVAVAQRFSW